MNENPYRALPAVDALAEDTDSTLPLPVRVDIARLALDLARAGITGGETPDVREMAARLARAVERSSGIRVINASGVLLHTNLGRAVWSKKAAERAVTTATGFTNLEMDLDTGRRGLRGAYITRLLQRLTSAEDALVVNNNAAALLLALATTSRGKSVPVSRGELIEIGGSYRLPDVMGASGARMVEIGTTNRTRLGDYLTALQTHDCGAVLKVHPSNYEVDGFTEEATLEELATVKPIDVPLLFDLGSGLLDATYSWIPDWLRTEPAARQSLASGADAVMFSGDKLLGGPQSGIIVGRADLIGDMRSHPLARALRADGVTYAALSATLEAYLEATPTEIPLWRHALTPAEDLETRLKRLTTDSNDEITTGSSVVGAGSAPGLPIPTPVLRIPEGGSLFGPLLDADVPIVARRDRGDLVLDLRAVEPEDDQVVANTLARCR